MKYEIEIRRRAEKDFIRRQEELEDYHDLLALREAKADSRNQNGCSFDEAAKELGLKKNKS